VNGVFGDPALYIDFRFEKRALLFDLGDIAILPPRKLLRLTDVFVSHAHMDHFAGFDRLLRVCLGRGPLLRLYGPPGFIAQVEHKLSAYTWNKVDRYPGDFTLLAHEVAPDWRMQAARFRSRTRFEREPQEGRSCADGVLLDERAFRVRATFLDHGIPCLAFAFEEKTHVNVWKNRLAEMGLRVGPWLAGVRDAVMQEQPDDIPLVARWRDGEGMHERSVTLGELKSRALELVRGERLCYVTDIVYHEDNAARVARFAAEADLLYIETVFLAQDGEHAARKLHLTAEQAGSLARAARAKVVVPFHFSPRYMGREDELRAELERARQGIPADFDRDQQPVAAGARGYPLRKQERPVNKPVTDELPQLGAPDPERKNSPIIDESEYDEHEASPDLEIEEGVCYFNDEAFEIGQSVRSGSELLQCSERGVWVRKGEKRPD
jgi:ribonuclease Z